MEKREKDDSASTVAEKHYADFEPAPAPTMGPNGAIQVGFVGAAVPAPIWNEDNVVCARGPCRHFWHLVTTVGEGNPAETWAELGIAQPRQHSYTCLVNPGMETEFGNDAVFGCNLWDPLTDSELAEREMRRELYQIRRRREMPVERVEDVVDDDEPAELPAGGDAAAAIAKETARAYYMAGRTFGEDDPWSDDSRSISFEELWARNAQTEEEKGS